MILDLSKKLLRSSSLVCAASVLALGNASYAVAEETIEEVVVTGSYLSDLRKTRLHHFQW